MTPKLITTTALLATLALGVVPAAANANDREGYRGGDGYGQDWQGRGNRDDRRVRARNGYGGDYARQGYQGRQVYNQGYAQGNYQGYGQRGAYGQSYNQGYAQRGYGGGYNGGYNGGYYQQRPAAYGYNQGYRCRNNSTGTILGAIAGGLIGNGVAGRGDKVLGTVIGGGAGALIGNGIDKSNRRC